MRSHHITDLRSRARRLRAAALSLVLLAVAGWWLAPPVFAKIVSNTIDPQAAVTDNGRHLVVTGPLDARRASAASSA